MRCPNVLKIAATKLYYMKVQNQFRGKNPEKIKKHNLKKKAFPKVTQNFAAKQKVARCGCICSALQQY